MERTRTQDVAIALFIVFSLGLTSGIGTAFVSPGKTTSSHRGITWDVIITGRETGTITDTVVFGEAPDARDGPPEDSYDVAKPPFPMPPYLRLWSSDNLTIPYSALWNDYRHYPGTSKTWNISVQWWPADSASPTTVTLSWDRSRVNASEYSIVTLCTWGGGSLCNMRTQSSYSFACPAIAIQRFKVVCHVNHAPAAPSTPSPANESLDLPLNTTMSWTATDPDGDPLTFDVYFGNTTTPPLIVHNQTATTYSPTLYQFQMYHWRIVAWDVHHWRTSGPSWWFTTYGNHPPYTPNTPSPANGTIDVPLNKTLSWLGGDPDPGNTVTYDVYFGTATNPPLLVHNQTALTYAPTLAFNTIYYWKIVAWDNHNSRTAGPIWHFTTHLESAPYTPNTPNPGNGATGVSLTPILSWLGGDPNPGDTVTYDVYFGNSTTPPLVIHNQSALAYAPGSLLPHKAYYWRIKAWDNHGYSAAGPTWSFTTLNRPPNTPSSPSPTNGAVNVSVDATLSWTGGDPDGDAVLYDVYFGTSPNPPIVSHNQTGTSYDPPASLLYNTVYYWHITARDGYGGRTNGTTWFFTTKDRAPYVPNHPGPADGSINVPITNDLNWTGGDPDPSDSVTYDVYFGTTSTPPLVVHNQTLTTYDPGTMNYSTHYYWKITAWDTHHNRTYGPLWSFTTVVNLPPYAPSSPNPSNGETNVLVTTNLSWTGGDPEGDPVKYDVYFGTSSSPTLAIHNQTGTSFDPGTLTFSTQYFWKIVAWDSYNNRNASELWSFTTQVDSIPPNVRITQPLSGFFYLNFFGIREIVFPFPVTVVWGHLTVKVNATDNQSGVNRVEFYLNGDLMLNDTSSPYEWPWTQRTIFPCILKIIAYDNDENQKSVQLNVWKIF